MKTETEKSGRVKWHVVEHVYIVTEHSAPVGRIGVAASQHTLADIDNARQIVHEHNTWGELVAVLKNVIRDEECYCADLALKEPCYYCQAKAALAAAEKEEG